MKQRKIRKRELAKEVERLKEEVWKLGDKIDVLAGHFGVYISAGPTIVGTAVLPSTPIKDF